MGTRILFLRTKWPGHDDHSSLSSAEVKNEWSYTCTPSICIHGLDRNTFSYFTACQVCVCYVLSKEFYINGHLSKFVHTRRPLRVVTNMKA